MVIFGESVHSVCWLVWPPNNGIAGGQPHQHHQHEQQVDHLNPCIQYLSWFTNNWGTAIWPGAVSANQREETIITQHTIFTSITDLAGSALYFTIKHFIAFYTFTLLHRLEKVWNFWVKKITGDNIWKQVRLPVLVYLNLLGFGLTLFQIADCMQLDLIILIW